MNSDREKKYSEDNYDLELGSVLYLKDDLNTKLYLYDILQTVYPTPKYQYLYYMEDSETPYRRGDFMTKIERRKIIIRKFLKNKIKNKKDMTLEDIKQKDVVYFSASWCGPCKVTKPIVEKVQGQGTQCRA